MSETRSVIGGDITIQIGDQTYMGKGDFEIIDGGFEFHEVEGQGAVKKRANSSITGAISNFTDGRLKKIWRENPDNVVVQAPTGETFSMTDPWFNGQKKLQTAEGEIPVDYKSTERLDIL